MELQQRQIIAAYLPGILASAALLIAAFAGVGWLTGSSIMTSLLPGFPTLKPSTLSMISCLAIALLLTKNRAQYTPLAILCVIYSGFLSLAYLTVERKVTSISSYALAPAPATSAALLLLSIALAMLLMWNRSATVTAGLVIVVLLLSLYRLITHLVGFENLDMSVTFESMSFPTSLALSCLAIAIFLHSRLPFVSKLTADTLQGKLLRTTLPWTLLTPSVVAALLAITIRRDTLHVEIVMVILIVTLTILMTYLLWVLSIRLEHADQQRRSAEQTRLVSENHAKQIIEHSPIAKLVVNETGCIEHVNLRLEQMLGYDRQELFKQKVEILIPERFRASHSGFMHGYINAPNVRNMGEGRELFARHKDGSEVPVEIALAPLQTPQGTLILANIVDITARWKYQADIKAALHEKTLLLKEIHHRVKNNLQIVASLLRLQAGRVADTEFSALIAESEGRVRAMALMHQVLYERNDYSKVELDAYLKRLSELTGQIYGSSGKQILIHIEAEPVSLDLTRAIPLGLIVNELFSNIFKHAFPDAYSGEAWIELKLEDEQAFLTVRDNGCGLPANFNPEQSNTLGMQIVHLLAEQIAATLSVISKEGTRFELRFTPSQDNGSIPSAMEQVN